METAGFDRQGDGAGEPALVIDVDGYEGPLDLLLDLARRQKVDLHKISVLALVEQYLAFIAHARRIRLELAADYLVMAAWLAYLKSRLLLPSPPRDDEPAAADLAAALAQRLKRLEAIRAASARLMERPRLGRDMFLRGAPEASAPVSASGFTASLYDLLSAYARQRQRHSQARVTLRPRFVWSIPDARAALEAILSDCADWSALEPYLDAYLGQPGRRRTVRASSFCAALELAREGRLHLRQDRAFGPLWLRARARPQLAVDNG